MDEQIKKWVKTWNAAESAMQNIRKKEISAPDYYIKNRDILNDMLWYACEHATVRKTTGLVEQQYFFKLIHEKQNDPI
ncbi:MAG: hypothetical protein U5R06_11180 [candidate division KSB1 bacterium]|nr:hypothetical protein [candidate division KSB1 bacterium]